MSYDQDPYEALAVDHPGFKHTGLGIASFIISLFVGFLAFALFAVAGVLEVTTPGGLDEDSPTAMLLGLGLFALVFVNLVGLILGFAGIFQARRNKTFAVLGIVIGGLTFVGMALLIVVGALMD
jgi:hypothetical protein